MVKIMENPIKMEDLGGKTTYFWKHPNIFRYLRSLCLRTHLSIQWLRQTHIRYRIETVFVEAIYAI